MIKSAQEFVELRNSSNQEDYLRAATDTAPIDIWIEITQTFPDMKVWVVRNKTVPVAVLSHLASDPDSNVSSAVAMKNKLPLDLMLLLANDRDESVRQRIAYNKNADIAVLEKLATDESELVSSQARRRIQLLGEE
jgi:hypothetical protein